MHRNTTCQTLRRQPDCHRGRLIDNDGVDAANRLTALDNGTYTNDANGNTLTGGGRTNTWDSQNRLTQCVYTSGSTTNTSNFTYGADGYRHRAVVNDGTTTTTTDYVLDGDNAVREMRGGVNYATYLTGVGGPVYKRYDQSGAVSWYVYDGLGSVIAEVSPTGTVTCGNKYDVYGAVRGRTGTSTTSHGFVGALGHMSEANTGLIYMRARYYDPSIGRFASEDPGKHGTNWFTYADCNPTNKLDQNGKETDWFADLIALIGVAVAVLVAVALAPADIIAALSTAAVVVLCLIMVVVGSLVGYVLGHLLNPSPPEKKEAENPSAEQEQDALFSFNVPIIDGLPVGEALSMAELGMSETDA